MRVVDYDIRVNKPGPRLEPYIQVSKTRLLHFLARPCFISTSSWPGTSRPKHTSSSHLCAALRSAEQAKLASSGTEGPRPPGTATTTQRPSPRASSSGPTGGGDPDGDPGSGTSSSFQIGLDPFSQQLVASALTGGGALAIASWAQLDLSSALRLNLEALAIAAQLSTPVLVLLLGVLAPRWAPPYKGSELERLRHNYYMTAQVLQLYLDFDDDDDVADNDRDGDAPGGDGERARVRRRLRLEQTVGWGTISSGLALMQAFTLQPWNPPTANDVFGLGLAGRSIQQLANEFLVRGVLWGLLSSLVAGELSSADASDGILFYGKVFGGPDTVKYVSGLALVALALPGALWEARAARNFVRASVVGPVRDAAIFCTGNGVDEPAYCDPAGFAMLAARKPVNAAFVADVVTRTRGWRSGPEASFTSVSSLGSVDLAELDELEAAAALVAQRDSTKAEQSAPTPATTTTTTPTTTSSSTSSAFSSDVGPHTPATPSASSPLTASSPAPNSSAPPAATSKPAMPSPPRSADEASVAASTPSSSSPSSAAQPVSLSAAAEGGGGGGREGGGGAAEGAASKAAAGATADAASAGPSLGATVRASTVAFEWDSEDMSVLLRVETLQDRIAFWSSLYYQLLAAFAINGAFLASDCNLAASFLAAWLLRTGPLLLAELRARAAADLAMR